MPLGRTAVSLDMGMSSSTSPVQRMLLRDPHEEGRSSTSLELFFDLVFVVTIASIAQQWHHTIMGGHIASGVFSLAVTMFAVWWAWMGFTWFANFFDPDDVPYRLLVLVQLLASLGLASGIPYVFEDNDFRIMTGCYVVIRIAMSAQWLRAGRANPHLKRYCIRWATGIWACQLFWIAFGFTRPSQAIALPLVIIGCIAELAVPIWVNRLPADQRAATHPEHAEERYGLFTIIILGEMVLSASAAFDSALEDHTHLLPLIVGALCAGVLAFCLWWLYFGFLGTYDLRVNRTAFIWGFGHYFVFAALTAAGGAMSALLGEIAGHESPLPAWGMALTLALPVALFLAAAAVMRRASNTAFCGRWLQAAAAVVIVGTAAGSAGTVWALVSVCATLCVFLATEIATRAKHPGERAV